ncbi:MAG: VWA domain-containing protein [Planctomycetota bacterium]
MIAALSEHFAAPSAWPLLFVAPSAWLALRTLEARRARVLDRRVGPRGAALHDWSRERARLRRLLFAFGGLCAAVAAMQPLGAVREGAGRSVGSDVAIAFDVSLSMLAEDAGPSGGRARLDVAADAVRALAGRAVGDRFSLTIFAGEARAVAPLTRDLGAVADLAALADPGDVARGGSDVASGIRAALATLAASDTDATVLVLTDGCDDVDDAVAAAREAVDAGARVLVVGIGSAAGARIPLRGADGELEAWLRDADGAEVVARVDADRLAAIASAGVGAYRAGELGATALYEREIAPRAARTARTAAPRALVRLAARARSARLDGPARAARAEGAADDARAPRPAPRRRVDGVVRRGALRVRARRYAESVDAFRRLVDERPTTSRSATTSRSRRCARATLAPPRRSSRNLRDVDDAALARDVAFLVGNLEFERARLAARQAQGPEAEPFAFDVAIGRARAAVAAWRDAYLAGDGRAELRRNLERGALLVQELERLRAESRGEPLRSPGGAPDVNLVRADPAASEQDAPRADDAASSEGGDGTEGDGTGAADGAPLRASVDALVERLAAREREKVALRRERLRAFDGGSPAW